jgi:hypothetical protein
MKCAKTYSCNVLYGVPIEPRILNTEYRMSKECVLPFEYPVLEDTIQTPDLK